MKRIIGEILFYLFFLWLFYYGYVENSIFEISPIERVYLLIQPLFTILIISFGFMFYNDLERDIYD